MKDKTKILYACKNDNCGVVLGCENIFTKGGMPCMYCGVKDNCTMRVAPLKYANTFMIKQAGYCDKCWDRIKELGGG